MKKIFFLFFVLSIFIFFVLPVSATTVISPIVEMAVFPGETQKGFLKVYNETDQEITLQAVVKPFSISPGNNQPQNLLPSEKDGYLSWFKLSQDELKLLPQQAAVVPFEVIAPTSAVPGGYYAVIFWEEKYQANKSNLTLSGRVGTLVFLRVNGDLDESLAINKFGLKEERFFSFGLPFNFSAKLENIGNVHLWPKGEITLKNIFGQTKKISFSDGKTAILPANTRQFETIFPGRIDTGFLILAWEELQDLFFGPIRITATFNYGQPQKNIEQSFVLWVFPLKAMILVVGIIFILFSLILINRKVNKLKGALKNK